MSTIKLRKRRFSPLPHAGRDGFTIVELLVASLILLLAVFAVVAMVRKSSEMQTNDYHRREARAIAMRYFETAFAYDNFSGVYTVNRPATPTQPAVITVATDANDVTTVSVTPTGTPINPLTFTVPVNTPTILGGNVTVSIWVTRQTLNTPNAPVEMDVNNVRIRVTWTELDNSTEFIEMEKRLLTEEI